MLVLTRAYGDSIVIGEDVLVTLLSVEVAGVPLKNAKVKLGITAPDSTRVDREEIRKLKDSGNPPPEKRSNVLNRPVLGKTGVKS